MEGNGFDRGWLVRAGGSCCSSDGVWPNVDQARPARGGSGAPRRGPCQSKVDPRRLPPTSEPRLGDRLVRGPGGVWARDIPLYRRAVPGQRHGDSPVSCWFKPCARRWPGAKSRQDQREPRPADPLPASQFRQGPHLRRQGMVQVMAAVELSVVGRSGPVVTAVNGTLVARPSCPSRSLTSRRYQVASPRLVLQP